MERQQEIKEKTNQYFTTFPEPEPEDDGRLVGTGAGWKKLDMLLEQNTSDVDVLTLGYKDISYDKITGHAKQTEVKAVILHCYSSRHRLHVPGDVKDMAMDVSTPCGVRDGGAMWNKDNRSYSTMDNCKQDDEYDWTTMGHTSYMELYREG